MKKFCVELIISLFAISVNAQNVKNDMNQASLLMEKGQYNDAYRVLNAYTDKDVENCGDTCAAYYNYYKGSCLYYLKRYDESIVVLQKGIQFMDKLKMKNCDYLEMLYGIGSSYKEMNNYAKAEEYYRRTILKGTYLNLNCAIRNQTYSAMAELYTLMGKSEFADICVSRIESEMRLEESKDFNMQVSVLWDLYKAHETQGKIDDCINDLKKIRHLIEENRGKNNEDYLGYSLLLGSLLRYSCNRPYEAATVHREMIEIGKQFKSFRGDICSSYVDYLRYLAENNMVDSIELLLPSAIKYYAATKDKSAEEENLYELVGLGLCDAKNMDEGVKYLEKEWNGKSANSIKALDYLGTYYFYIKNDAKRAFSYYLNAEQQIKGGLETSLDTKILILENLILISQRLGNSNEAVRYSTLLEPLLRERNDDNYRSTFLVDWSIECVNNGNIKKAEELAGIVESLLSNLPNDTKIRQYSQLGFIYIKTEKFDKSIDNTNKGINLAIQEKGDKCIELTTLYHNLGRAYMLKGDYSNALSALNKSKMLQIELEGEVMHRTADYIKECESK